MNNATRALKDYMACKHLYESLASRVCQILNDILTEEYFDCLIISGRAKEENSFMRKMLEKRYVNPMHDMSDLAGVRVVVASLQEVDVVCKIIEETFSVDLERSPNKTQELGIEKVGYRSRHYVCSLSDDRLNMKENRQYEGRYFEIQVRTLLEHSWAVIYHKVYKNPELLGPEEARLYHILSGSLEAVDLEFEQIVKTMNYRKESAEFNKRKTDSLMDTKISRSSIANYLVEYLNYEIPKAEAADYKLVAQIDVITMELRDYGLLYLTDVQNIVDQLPKKVAKELSHDFVTYLRVAMILLSSERYFDFAWKRHWNSADTKTAEILDSMGIDLNLLNRKYDIFFPLERDLI